MASAQTPSLSREYIRLGGRVIAIENTPCSVTLTPASAPYDSDAHTGSVSVTAGCAWTATSNNTDWLNISSGGSGTGNGTVNYSITANTCGNRTGTLTIGGQTFTVTQTGPCTYSISPTNASYATYSGTGTVGVTTSAGCSWAATSNAAWLHITSGANGAGPGSVGYSVDTNSGAVRDGTLTVAGQTFAVHQDGIPCSFTLTPTSATFSSDAGNGTVSVGTTAGCNWTAARNPADTWITITSGSSGTGNGTVYYSVAANTGPVRNGSMSIAGITFPVTQSTPAPAETVSLPNPPTGTSYGQAGVGYTYTTGGASSNLGHPVVYQFLWSPAWPLDSGSSGWLGSGVTTFQRAWPDQGDYMFWVKARCLYHPDKEAVSAYQPIHMTPAANLLLSNQILTYNPWFYQAVSSITAQSGFIVSGSASVTFRAGTTIYLEPGFQATAGTANPTFRAYIQ